MQRSLMKSSAFSLLFLLACNRPPIEPGGAMQGTDVDPGTDGPIGDGDQPTPGGDGDSTVTPPGGGDGDDGEIIDDEDPPPMVVKTSCGDWEGTDPWAPGYKRSAEVEKKVADMLGTMSLDEKIEQMHGQPTPLWQGDLFSSPDNSNKGIRGFLWRDGPRGVNLFEEKTDIKQGATCFPVGVARAATFDRDLEYAVGDAIGKETLASGHNVILAPTVNNLRHPGWGRSQETYGEDTFVLGKMGNAFILGAQQYVPACTKHYAANNIEDTRQTNNAVIDEQTLHEVYLRHFEQNVNEAGVACIMSAYNRVNGPYASESEYLLDTVLRKQWGYRGFVVSDWGAAHNVTEAATAGLDVEMPNHPVYSQLRSVVDSGQVNLQKVNDAVTHILEQKYRFNIAELGQPMGLKQVSPDVIGSKEHTDLAYQTALMSMTLLKNDKGALPIDKKTVKKIAVVGPWAAQRRLGDEGSSNVFPKPERVVPPFQGIKARAGDGIQVVNSSNASAVAGADVVIVVAALSSQDEGEAWNGGGDRDSLEVSSDQVSLIHQVAEMHDRVIVVLEGGGPITMQSWKNEVEGIVMAWYPGEKGGLAIADVLFGDANFGGHVPMTWPKKLEDEPVFGNKQAETKMGFLHGYRHFDDTGVAPLFPFGFGLSYTTFEYKNLQVPCSDVTPDGMVEVKVDITNTGDRAGDTVAFLFVSVPDSKVRRAKKDLKAFTRVSLDPGQTKRVTLPIMAKDLAYWDVDNDKWVVEKTEYKVLVGPDAATLPLSDTFLVK